MAHWTSCVPALALVLAAGCGTTDGSYGPLPAESVGSQPANESTEGIKPGPVVLDVTIIDGEVKPRGARVELKVGQPLTLSVHSDKAEELHVHTDPEQEFAVKPNDHQRFTFTVDRPGKVAVEVHHLDAVIAEVLVRK